MAFAVALGVGADVGFRDVHGLFPALVVVVAAAAAAVVVVEVAEPLGQRDPLLE